MSFLISSYEKLAWETTIPDTHHYIAESTGLSTGLHQLQYN